MHQEPLVGILNCATYLQEQSQTLLQVGAVLPAPSADRKPLNVLHHQIGRAVFGAASVQQTGDVWMLQGGEDLAFSAKPLEDFWTAYAAADELDRHSFFELGIVPPGFIHRAHATLADPCRHPIGAETPANPRIDILAVVIFVLAKGGQGQRRVHQEISALGRDVGRE